MKSILRICWFGLTLLLAACSGGGNNASDAGTDAGTDAGADGGADEECTDDVWVDTFDEAECPDMSSWDDCVVHVRTDGSPGGDGRTWATATSDIQDAANTARCGVIGTELCDEWQVWIATGTYYVFEKCNSDTVYLRSDVALYGGFAGDETELEGRDPVANETILNGANGPGEDHRVVSVIDAIEVDGATLDGLTITGGSSSYPELTSGGGLWAQYSTISINDCLFTGNEAAWGAGLGTNETDISIIGSRFVGNFGYSSSAVDTIASTVLIVGCTFSGNQATVGVGAVQLEQSTVAQIIDSVFTGNSGGIGGALRLFESSVDVQGCDFDGNAGGVGGAVQSDYSMLDIEESPPSQVGSGPGSGGLRTILEQQRWSMAMRGTAL